jgi:hypothetical protein
MPQIDTQKNNSAENEKIQNKEDRKKTWNALGISL